MCESIIIVYSPKLKSIISQNDLFVFNTIINIVLCQLVLILICELLILIVTI